MKPDPHRVILSTFLSSGEQNSFQDLYFVFFPLFVRYGKTFTQDGELVRDVIQDLFVWVWQNREKLNSLEQPVNYLYRAFRNNLRAEVIRVKNKKDIVQRHKSSSATPYTDIAEIPEEEKSAFVYSYLQGIITQLPEKQREVIFLRFYEEKSFSEIGEILSVSTQVAQNYALRALKKLRKHQHILEKIIYPLLLLLALS